MNNTVNDKDDKDDELEDIVVKPFNYYTAIETRKVHHFYISTVIGEPGLYIDMVNAIRTASPHDIVYIHLNTGGGTLATGVQLIAAMRSSQAHIIASVEGEVCSLGTLIFLAADEFVVNDYCLLMFHNYSGATFGKGHEQIAQLEATTTWFNQLARDIYIPFMTETEWQKIEDGGDLWMQSDEIRTRLTKMVKQLEKEKKAEERAAKRKS